MASSSSPPFYILTRGKATQPVDIGAAFFRALPAGAFHPGQLETACRGLDAQRTQAASLSAVLAGAPGATLADGGTGVLSAYIASLNVFLPHAASVEARLPWTDAFAPTRSVALALLSFERAAVLVNLAVATAAAGAADARASAAEGHKAALKAFKVAAGLLGHLAAAPPPIAAGDVTVDLSSDGLAALRSVMLANAQMAYYRVAARAKVSDELAAKLAAGAVKLLDATAAHCASGALAGDLGVREVLAAPVEAASRLFAAEAHARMAAVADAGHDMAAQLGHLREASTALTDAREIVRERLPPRAAVGDTLLQRVAALEGSLTARRERADLENRSIYLQTASATLPTIEARVAVAPADVDALAVGTDGADPQTVALLSGATRARAAAGADADTRTMYGVAPDGAAAEARAEAARNDAAAAAEVAVLTEAMVDTDTRGLRDAYGQLSASLAAADSVVADATSSPALRSHGGGGGGGRGEAGPPLPAEVLDTVKWAVAAGGARGLDDLSRQVSSMAQKVNYQVATVQRSLASEAAADERAKADSRGALRRPASADLNRPYVESLERIRGELATAARSDAFVVDRLASRRAELARLDDLGDLSRVTADEDAAGGGAAGGGAHPHHHHHRGGFLGLGGLGSGGGRAPHDEDDNPAAALSRCLDRLHPQLTSARSILSAGQDAVAAAELRAATGRPTGLADAPAGGPARHEWARARAAAALARPHDHATRLTADARAAAEALDAGVVELRRAAAAANRDGSGGGGGGGGADGGNTPDLRARVVAAADGAAAARELHGFLTQGLTFYTKETEVLAKLLADVDGWVAARGMDADAALAAQMGGLGVGGGGGAASAATCRPRQGGGRV
ncbi:hypothetical protein BU14_0183s0023 [Porphyra umbilicalis]|uniref:BRO1 domain-containing protein n=1 Tax=Porphyra umbilicalis TaxID=2786 RepID=A0A1X6P6W5_PORUM|nr:hypothetical protein BU14_0183s0023 [Porphyra umbilicalis]|eukprot:OSX76631.1 hypothetical protein BU14_0183s0023 [Porphyra umbilicalis]